MFEISRGFMRGMLLHCLGSVVNKIQDVLDPFIRDLLLLSMEKCIKTTSIYTGLGVPKTRGTPKWMVYNGEPY